MIVDSQFSILIILIIGFFYFIWIFEKYQFPDWTVITKLQKQKLKVCNVLQIPTIQKWKILDTAFSIDGGELTPTMKIKRRIVNVELHTFL